MNVFTQPLYYGYDMKWNSKQSKAGLNSEFSFLFFFLLIIGYLTKTKEPGLPNNLVIAGGRTNAFIPFLRALA